MKVTETGKDISSRVGAEEHVVVFRLADEFYALDIQAVQEIVRMQAITAIPGSEAWITGITNLRGRVVPVLDLRVRCGVRAAEPTPEMRIVVVNGATGMVGLIVDGVSEVMRIPAEQVESPSAILSVPANGYLRGIAKLEGRLISLMDLKGVLPSEAPDENAASYETAAAA